MKKLSVALMIALCSFSLMWGMQHTAAQAAEEIALNPVFSDHMVLQREKPVEIYGTAAAGQEVKVTFKGQEKTAAADASGNFSVLLDEMQADPVGAQLVIECGSARKTIEDVLVGEVFFGSGQSNMAYGFDEHTYAESVMKTDPAWGVDYDKYKDLTTSYLDDYRAYQHYGLLRFYTQKMLPETNGVNNKGVQNTWIAVEGVSDLDYVSVTATAFAIHMSQKLGDVPVGVLVAAVGGSQIHEWISEESAQEIFPGSGNSTLSQRYNNMLLPMGRFTIRGVLWYQGESDVYGNLETYRQCFGAWLRETREFFGDEALPVLTFQLPQFEDEYCKGLWPAFRTLQEELAQDNENVYYVCGIDLGDHRNIHPLQKWEFCERAAGLALKYIFGEEYGGSGSYGQNPTVSGLYRKTGAKTVYMRFQNATQISVSEGITCGLIATTNKQNYASIDSFEKVDDNTVAFSTKLKYISYLQNNTFDYDTAFIYNEYGLPVAPFTEREVTSYDHDVTVELQGCTSNGFERYFAMSGDRISFTITPEEGAQFELLTINGENVDFGDGTITLENISEDVQIVCTFRTESSGQTPDGGGGAGDTPSVPEGDSQDDGTAPQDPEGEPSDDSPQDDGGGAKGCGGSIGLQSALTVCISLCGALLIGGAAIGRKNKR